MEVEGGGINGGRWKEIWERDGKTHSFVQQIYLKEDENLALEMRGAFI